MKKIDLNETLRSFLASTKTTGAYVYNGVDRVNNALGYTPDNVVPCCKTCNIAKRDMDYNKFLSWIARLCEYAAPKGTLEYKDEQA